MMSHVPRATSACIATATVEVLPETSKREILRQNKGGFRVPLGGRGEREGNGGWLASSRWSVDKRNILGSEAEAHSFYLTGIQ